MAYTTIDDPTSFFNTILWTGDNTARTISGVGFQPDWIWWKQRNGTDSHRLADSVRGEGSATFKLIFSEDTSAEYNGNDNGGSQGNINDITSDGFSGVQGSSGYNNWNGNSYNYVAWNWKAGGSAPAITYVVKVVSDSGNKYRFDDFGTSAVTLDLQEGGTYTFDQSDSSNSGHPLRFYTASDKSGGEYTTGVTTTGTAGSSGAKTVITVAASAPTLYYQCSNHAGMGGQANTNSTFGSSNFSGNIQSTVSAGSTQGFSIVSWTGTGSTGTLGHGLGVTPQMIIVKKRDTSGTDWITFGSVLGGTVGSEFIKLNFVNAKTTGLNTSWFNQTAPTSSVFTVGTQSDLNGSGATYIAYCFVEKKGYSKIGSYTGNGNTAGPFVYTGFRPAWIISKRTDNSSGGEWNILDNKRDTFNVADAKLEANNSDAEETDEMYDILSNGFKITRGDGNINASSGTYIFMAFAESPFVNSNGVPTNAR